MLGPFLIKLVYTVTFRIRACRWLTLIKSCVNVEMGSIETTIDIEKDLTINTCKGEITYEVIHKWLESYYSDKVTTLILWNLLDAELSKLDVADLKKIVLVARNRVKERLGGKTALVLGKDVDFGLGRMLMAYSDNEDVGIDLMVFRSVSKAMDWFGIEI